MADIKIGVVFIAFFLTASLRNVESVTDCSIKPDGHYEISCKAYDECKNNVLTQVECGQDMVYDHNLPGCNAEKLVAPPCGLYRDCSIRNDGTYPDYELNCTSYFTCHNNFYYGHNFCPDDLVFDSTLLLCTWPRDVYPPCGTKG
ncbi:hypothetical protein ACF0H5_016502 [Mactra antiquata]